MPSTKLDYLSKYYSSSGNNDGENDKKKSKKDKKKKDKKKKSKHNSKDSGGGGSGGLIVDEDNEWNGVMVKREDDMDEDNEEDRPTIVDDLPEDFVRGQENGNSNISSNKPRGSWEVVTGPDGIDSGRQGNGDAVKKESSPSPPRRRRRYDSDNDDESAAEWTLQVPVSMNLMCPPWYFEIYQQRAARRRQQQQRSGSANRLPVTAFNPQEVGMTTERQRAIQASLFKMLGQAEEEEKTPAPAHKPTEERIEVGVPIQNGSIKPSAATEPVVEMGIPVNGPSPPQPKEATTSTTSSIISSSSPDLPVDLLT